VDNPHDKLIRNGLVAKSCQLNLDSARNSAEYKALLMAADQIEDSSVRERTTLSESDVELEAWGIAKRTKDLLEEVRFAALPHKRGCRPLVNPPHRLRCPSGCKIGLAETAPTR
jgi:hypothetical protein